MSTPLLTKRKDIPCQTLLCNVRHGMSFLFVSGVGTRSFLKISKKDNFRENDFLEEEFTEQQLLERDDARAEFYELQNVVVNPGNFTQSIEMANVKQHLPSEPSSSSHQLDPIWSYVENNISVEDDKLGERGEFMGHLSFDLNDLKNNYNSVVDFEIGAYRDIPFFSVSPVVAQEIKEQEIKKRVKDNFSEAINKKVANLYNRGDIEADNQDVNIWNASYSIMDLMDSPELNASKLTESQNLKTKISFLFPKIENKNNSEDLSVDQPTPSLSDFGTKTPLQSVKSVRSLLDENNVLGTGTFS